MNDTPDSSGFYKLDGATLLSGTLVSGPTYTLIAGDHMSYAYPVDGWYWFDSEAEAKAFFAIAE